MYKLIMREPLTGGPSESLWKDNVLKVMSRPEFGQHTEMTLGRGDLGVCPLGGFTGAQE